MTVLEQTYGVADFFGCFLHQVNPIILRLGIQEGRPDWLRGRPKLADLPRWKHSPNNTVVRMHKKITPEQAAERVRQIVETYEHGWSITVEGFTFEDDKEAVHFKLFW